MSLCSKTIFCIYWIELTQIFVIVSGNECPVQIVSNRLSPSKENNGRSVFGGEQWENHDYFPQAKLNIKRPDKGSTSGRISSKEFTPDESVNFRCQFIFIGALDERVQIIFSQFRLRTLLRWPTTGLQNVTDLRCEEEDHLTAHVLVGSRMSKIHDFCGHEFPPQLMSTKNVLTIDYVVKSAFLRHQKEDQQHQQDPEEDKADMENAWSAEYRFITDLGKQPDEVSTTENKSCSFLFNSSMEKQGSVWSPNYPGFYPRNLDCQYEFVGTEKQVVLISFEYFDVEGFGQCEESTQSDYVLFSNYKTMDRTNRRYCGGQRPRRSTISSENNYFRMQFHSNDIFDGTGFFARYQFLDEKGSKRRLKFSTSNAGRKGFDKSKILAYTFISYFVVQKFIKNQFKFFNG